MEMRENTRQYYLLFLSAKKNYCEPRLNHILGSDPSDYKNIYQKIQEILSDEEGIGIDSQNTRLQLTIEEKLSPHHSDEIQQSLSVFGTIRDAIQGKTLNFSNASEWEKAIGLSLLLHNHQKNKTNHVVPEEYTHIAESMFSLKKLGFNIQSVDGIIKEDDPELLRLTTAIDYRVSSLGSNGLNIFNQIISEKFSVNDMRFYLYRTRNTLPKPQEPHPPYGYVFNLFCKYTDSKPKLKNPAKAINEIQELSTHLATILDIDKMSPWANIHVSHENILGKIREWVLYPEVFYIPQLSPNHGKEMFPRLFELIEGLPSDCIEEILKTCAVLQRIGNELTRIKSVAGHFSEQDLVALCTDIASKQELIKILNNTSTSANLINKDYITPYDAHKSNIKETPLIKTKEGYLIANITTYNIAIFRALLKISNKHYPRSELKFGFALEEFIKEKFLYSNIVFHHSFKYKVPEYIRKEIQTKRHEGECDFIIETKEFIYLVEVKKKGLTKESYSGNIISLLTDTTLSFLKSINQLSIAELILLTDKKLASKQGVEILIGKRDVFKLAISFEDMASLQCDSIKTSLLTGLYNIEVNSTTDERGIIESINKSILEFTRIHNKISITDEKYSHSPFHHVSYISTPQLLTILENCGNNEDFSHRICRSNTIIYSLMDWYASYNIAKGKKLIDENMSVFKNKKLIT
tara:strand:- start:10086 stop:12164 length:2079 start_codon:yes stop_codon:yes gene_type:complete